MMLTCKKVVLVFLVLLISSTAYGAGTPVNTVIRCTGTAAFRYSGSDRAASSSQVQTTVAAAYDLSVLPTPANQSCVPGETVYYSYSITNRANCPDTIRITAARVSGAGCTLTIVYGGQPRSSPFDLPLPVDTTALFSLGVSTTEIDTTSTNSLTVSNQSGAGTEDYWPDWPVANGRDSQFHYTVTTCEILIPTVYVDCARPDDSGDGLSWGTAKKFIQSGINLAPSGFTVLVANGTYTGTASTSNVNLNFVSGRTITLRSVGGAANCIIDAEAVGARRVFNITVVTTSVINGFTLTRGNGGTGNGGGVYCASSGRNPTFVNCIISGNTSGSDGLGGGIFCYGCNPTFTNCTISGNKATDKGGGVYCGASCAPTFTNCVISGNTARNGGGICSGTSSPNPTFTNCTVSGNLTSAGTSNYGGGVYCASGTTIFRNSVIWRNTAGAAEGRQIYCTGSGSVVSLSYCCYPAGTVYTQFAAGGLVTYDEYCITEDPVTDLYPQFVDSLAPAQSTLGDYRLQSTSPCIDEGSNDLINATGVTTDRDSNPRIVDGDTPLDGIATVDMGAYERHPADFIVTPIEGYAPLEVQFTNLSIGIFDSWLWTFGDGTTDSTSWHPTHTYTGPAGTYTVSLRVTNSEGSYTMTKSACIAIFGFTYVSTGGSDANNGFSEATAKLTIQAGIGAAPHGWTVLVADGIYSGAGNTNLNFVADRTVTLRSAGGAANCVIDAGGVSGVRVFNITTATTSVIDGFTITGGYLTSGYGGGIYSTGAGGNPTFTNCTITGNRSLHGGGVGCTGTSSQTFANCTISNNTASGAGGGVSCAGVQTFTNCTISGNSAGSVSGGGGGVSAYGATPTFVNCTISGNTAVTYGGGVYLVNPGVYTFINCVISGNQSTGAARCGGGVYCGGGNPTLTNCTISGNTAAGTGGGVYRTSATVTLRNTIVWGNTAPTDPNVSGTMTIAYCDIEGGGTTGGNINSDPRFVSPLPAGLNTGGDYRLQSASLCIDRGSDALIPSGITTDRDGNPRISPAVSGTVDMGAYEYQQP